MTDNRPSSSASALSGESLRRVDEDAEQWVTLTSFSDTGEAEVVRSLLEQAQIPVRLTDAHTASMTGIPALALGGVGLQVPTRDLLLARAVIKDADPRTAGTVFLVANRAAVSSSAIAAAAMAVVASLASSWGLLPGRLVSVAIILAALVGMLVGRMRVFYLCSNLRCGARLQASTTVCPQCGGTVAGTIGSLNDRLEAEEQFRLASKGDPQ